MLQVAEAKKSMRAKSSRRELWKRNSLRTRKSLGLSDLGSNGWLSGKTLAGLSSAERVHDLVNVAVESTVKGIGDEPMPDLIVDVSQDVGRRPWTVDACRSLTTSSELLSVARRRVVVPREHFLLLGFPQVDLQGLSWACQRDLAGEAMSPAAVGFVLAIAMVCMATPSSTV